MTDKEFSDAIRASIDRIDEGGVSAALAELSTLQALPGVKSGIHIGKPAKFFEGNRRRQMEWFAGQVIDIIEKQSWFAMNSIINACEQNTSLEEK